MRRRSGTFNSFLLLVALFCVAPYSVIAQQEWPCTNAHLMLRNARNKPIILGSQQLKKRATYRVAPVNPSGEANGKVTVEVVIDANGKVACINLMKLHPLLREPIRGALRQWRFRPVLSKGRPAAVLGHLEFLYEYGKAGK